MSAVSLIVACILLLFAFVGAGIVAVLLDIVR